MSVANAVRNPISYLGGALSKLRMLLFAPGAFYEELDNRGIRTELFIVAIVGVIGAAGPYFAYTKIMTPFSTGVAYGEAVLMETEVQLRLQGQGVEPFLYTIVFVWVIFTVGFYFISWTYNERGRFRHMLKNVAWGTIPVGIGYAIQSAAFAYVASGLEVQTNNPDIWFRTVPRGTVATRVQYIWGQVTGEDLVIGATIVGLLFFIWSWYIWAHAIVDVRKIDLRQAYIVAAIPTALYAIYQLISILPL